MLLRLSFSFFISSSLWISSRGVFFLLRFSYDVTEHCVCIFNERNISCLQNLIRIFAIFCVARLSHLEDFANHTDSCVSDWQKAGQVFVRNFSCLSLLSFGRCYFLGLIIVRVCVIV